MHPGIGTANLLVALGPGRYLEILGPDINAEKPSDVSKALQALISPRIVWFAAAPNDIERIATTLAEANMTVMGPEHGSRATPDGELLEWRTVFAYDHDFGDQLPFFIDWGESPHPSATSIAGVSVEKFVVIHPRATELRRLYSDLGITIDVVEGTPAGFDLTLKSSGGELSFESRSEDAFFMSLFVPTESD